MEKLTASNALVGDKRSQALIDYLSDLEQEVGIVSGVIYYDYPLFRDSDDILYRSKVLLASRSHGVQIFAVTGLVDREFTHAVAAQLDADLSQLASIIFSKLIKSRSLRRSVRELAIPLQGFLILTDLPAVPEIERNSDNTFVYSLVTIREWLATNRGDTILSEEAWQELRSTLEGAKGILRPKERDLTSRAPNSKPAILARLENEVASFDANQRRAAISIADGPQRIRGLAGSGKTIILAMKAAHLHLNDPQATILLTFWTKSLYSLLHRLVTRFYRQFNDRDPNWSRIHILHAWGGKTVEGVYYNAAIDAGIAPLTYAQMKPNGFDHACSQLVDSGRIVPKYDYALMDEAQDFTLGFFRLCFELTKGGDYDRNIVWAYDELQNIMNVRMKTPEETFGWDEAGAPRIDLDRAAAESRFGNHDVVLHKCYRNPREVLVSAHALGFGIYSDLIVQMLENKEHWEDVGYVVQQGGAPGENTVVLRPKENSPLSISEDQTAEELISSYVAGNFPEEADWLASSIIELIDEGLRPDDIMVIALDDRGAKAYFLAITERLNVAGIRVNNVLNDPYNAPAFTIDGHVTLSTVYRAKGNEAAVVFACGIEAIFPVRKLQRGRNKIFTAFTRARAWLRVSGIGADAQYFVDELGRALRNFPTLKFKYPDPGKIVTLQRDLSDRAAKVKRVESELGEQLEMLDEEERAQVLNSLARTKK